MRAFALGLLLGAVGCGDSVQVESPQPVDVCPDDLPSR